MDKTIKYIHFHNNSDLPVMIDSWVDGSNKLHYFKIEPGEKRILHSSVGEWHMNAMFEDSEDRKKWNEKGLHRFILIGKFRSNPSIRGDYVWLEYDDPFNCEYSKIENEDPDETVKGLITYSINLDTTINKYV